MSSVLISAPSQGGAWQKVDGKWQTVGAEVKQVQPLPSQERDIDLEAMLKKYSSKIESTPKKKKKKKKKAEVQEWVDTSFIKNYTDHEALKLLMEDVETKYHNIAECYKLGHSEEGRELLCMRISSNVRTQRALLKPMVKFVANIHGDEAVGREMLIGLIRYLTENYQTDDRIRTLVDNTDIHLMPSVNPDGDALDTRHNVNDEDLNRGFPGWRDLNRPRCELVKNREKEVKAMMNWIMDHPFVLSVSFHDGRVMMNYPWDDSPDAVEGECSVCPDDDVFRHLAALYADHHPFMWTGKCLCHSDTFSTGISNGAEWYLVDNGMQDFNYLFSNCLELTAELSCWKRPPSHHLQVEWENNLDSLLAVLTSVHCGVKGKVTVAETGEPLDRATVEVVGREKEMVTTHRGEYWRLLLPGTYQIRATHTNKFGVIQLRLEDCFLVTGVKKGFCRFLDNSEVKEEVRGIFEDCTVTECEVWDEECKMVPDDPLSFQVAFMVRIVMDHGPMVSFFTERWDEVEVMRPGSEFSGLKLSRRAVMYSEEKWCGRRGESDWRVKRAQCDFQKK